MNLYTKDNNCKKYFLPINAVLLALVSVLTAASSKLLLNNMLSVICNFVAVMLVFSLVLTMLKFYGVKICIRAMRNVFIVAMLNLVLLQFLLLLPAADNNTSYTYFKSYLEIYKFNNIIIELSLVFLPLFILHIAKMFNNYFLGSVSAYSFDFVSEKTANKKTYTEYYGEYFDFKYILSMLCVMLLINSHSICYKFIELPYFGTVSASGILFPFTFIFADIVAEHYGYSASRQLIWSTLLGQFVFVNLVYIIYLLPAGEAWVGESSFALVFSNLLPRQIIAASICVFFSFFIFSFLISALKTRVYNKRFWKRTLIANIVAKAVLCTLSYIILYYGKYNMGYILNIILNTWLLKMLIATIGTFVVTIPFVYYLKLNDQRAYNYNDNYSPFGV